MPCLFDATTSRFGSGSVAPLTAAPLSIVCWTWTTTAAGNDAMVSVGDYSVPTDDYWELRGAMGTPTVSVRMEDSGVAAFANAPGTMPLGRWVHAGLTDDTNFITAWVAGMPTAIPTAHVLAPLNVDSLGIGGVIGAAASRIWGGHILWPAVYSAVLTDAEMKSLANGASPKSVRGGSLASFNRLRDSMGTLPVVSPEPTFVPERETVQPSLGRSVSARSVVGRNAMGR